MTLKRTLLLMLALTLACSMPLSCLAEAAENQRPTLTILMAQDTYVEDYETNAFTKYIEDAMNVNLDFILLPASDAADKLSVMISSGQKLPDIINYNLDVTTTYRYAQTGAFIPLNSYYETLGDNVKKVQELQPNILDYITCPDGNVYSIPSYLKALHDEVRYKIWINQTWLTNLNLEMPTTTEELYNVLKAFKEQDPNQNGIIGDEYPMVGATGWSQDVTINLMNAFIYDDSTDHFIVEDGKVDVSYNKEAWKQGLVYMRSLVDEKLLDPISFTQDDPQLRAMANNEEICIVGAYAFSSLTLLPVATSPYVKDFVGLAPMEGPEGISFSNYQPTLSQNRWFVTADCKNPELAFQVGDFLFDPTEEAFLRARFGIEGEHWSKAKEGDQAIFPGFEAMYSQDVNIWTQTQNAHWRNNAPLFTEKACQSGVWNGDPEHYDRKIGDIVMVYQDHRPADGTFVPTIAFTEEETMAISEIRSTLQTYVKECETRFITGDMDIETEWDSYLKELERIGVDEFIKVSQAAYDRMYK